MPRSSEQTTTRRLSVLADILQAYTKIRRIIQAARAAGTPRGKLVDQLMLRCSSRDILVLREIRRRLQQQKRANQPWGNVSKKDDRMFKMLAKSVKRSDVHDHNYQYASNRFVKESFRCRALCVTSNRFGKAGFLPKAPVPQKKLPYRVYGYVGLKRSPAEASALASSISCMAFASPSYAVQAEAVGYAVERALFCRCVCKTADFD